jgi:hypothetical protein
MDALATRMLVMRTNGVDADGEIVWSWPPDAEAKRAGTICARRGQESPVPGEITYKP